MSEKVDAAVDLSGHRDSQPAVPVRFGKVKDGIEWWQGSRGGRALARYSQANGGLLSGGIAYSAVFSLAAALTIGYSVLMAVLGSRTQLRASVTQTINAYLPGLLRVTPGGPGLIDPDVLVRSTAITPTSLVAAVVLLVSVTSCMAAIRGSVRVMFGLPPGGDNAFIARLRALGGFAIVASAVFVSAAVGVVVHTRFAGLLEEVEHWGILVIPVLAFAASFLIDMVVFCLIVIVLAGVNPNRNDLLLGAFLAAAGFGIVRTLGASVVVHSAQTNALLTSFAAVVVLFIWINLTARIVLTAAAVTADLPLAIIKQGSDVAAAKESIAAARRGMNPELRRPPDGSPNL